MNKEIYPTVGEQTKDPVASAQWLNRLVGEESMKTVTETNLQEQTKRYQGKGGTSAETREFGFRPAFLDTQTGVVYPCCFADGRPAPMHLFDGLPAELILAYAPSGRVVAVKGSIISGFIRGERFYTREEVSRQILEGTIPVNPIKE